MIPAGGTRSWQVIVPALVLHLALVALLGDWIMDDAGISYAYAENLAEGHGLVSQPGRPPVEGYSNFLWVLVLAGLFSVGLFEPVVAVKILAAVFVLLSLWLLRRALSAHLSERALALLLILVASAPPLVIWTTSGLENSLTMLLAAALYDQLVRQPDRWEIQSGILTALLAMNHPENALYVGSGLLVCLAPALAHRHALLPAIRQGAWYGGTFALLFGAFMTFRLLLFGLPFPHTYYAKRIHPDFLSQVGAMFAQPLQIVSKFTDLAWGVAGPLGLPAVIVVVAGATHLMRRGALNRALAVALAIQAVAIGAYLWIDADWMGEYRFATISVMFSLVSCALTVVSASQIILHERGRRWLGFGCVAASLMIVAGAVWRVERFAENPPTPFAHVAREYALKFNAYADILQLPQASVLLPDIGATLLYSGLTVYDVAGLCEPDLVRTLKGGTPVWRIGHPEFHGWVFETIKPTFISTAAFFTYVTALERDPRFARDYVAVNAYPDGYVQQVYGVSAHSGDYVRKDVLRGSHDLTRLQEGYEAAPASRSPFERWQERMPRWLGGTGGLTPPELMAIGLDVRYKVPNPRKATRLFERVLEGEPTHYGATYQLAAALDAAGRTEDARPVWRRMREMALASKDLSTLAAAEQRLGGGYDPTIEESMQAGLTALHTLRDPHRAIEQFQFVLGLNARHYGATYQLAAALDAARRETEARPLWETVLEMAIGYNDGPTADTARARLQR